MSAEPTYQVLAPTGRVVQDPVPINPHPADLSNKVVAFVWDYLFKGPIMFDAIRKLIQERFSGVKFIEHDHFGDIHGIETRRVLEELPAKLHAAGVDIAVVAVGA